jgi:D-alanyl-D-alanine dipeptidase
MASTNENEYVVPYKRDLPALNPAWSGFAPLPLLEPSNHWTPIAENGDPLVRIDSSIVCTAAQWRRGWPGTSPYSYVRQPVAAALSAARTSLPEGLDLVVLDAHRSRETQAYLYQRAYTGTGLAPGFVADPDDAMIVPPHTTGGAVDVTLAWQGEPLALGTAPGEYVADSFLTALEGVPGEARELRRVLFSVMTSAGFRGIPEEWWHYSIGDQEWAFQTGAPAAVYGSAERPVL